MKRENNLLGDNDSSFMREWTVLHNDHEKYERYSLLIKLTSALFCFLAIVFDLSVFIAIVLIAIVWLQDGIWKTFQSRMSDRILLIERYIKEQEINKSKGLENLSQDVSFQFYTDWEKSPKSTMGLVKEYLKSALRPTVAYPHIVLIILLITISIF